MSAQDDIQVKLGLNATAFGPALRGVTGHLSKFKADAGGIFSGFGKNLVEALTVGAIISQVKDLTSNVKQLRLEAKELDMSTGTIQTIQKQFKKMGEEPDKAIKGLEYFNIEIGKARKEGGAAAEAFKKYGISLSDANGMTKSSEEVMGNLADVLHKIEDPATRAAVAVEFFGKKNAKMGVILEGGSKALGELRAKLEKRGAIISQENEDALLRVEATFKRIMEMKQGNTGNLIGGIIKRVEIASQYLGASTAMAHGEDGALRVLQQIAAEDKARREVSRSVTEDLDLQKAIASTAKTIRDITFEEADEREKIRILDRERRDIFNQLVKTAEGSVEEEALVGEMAKHTAEIRKLQLSLGKSILEKEEAITEEKRKQRDLIREGFSDYDKQSKSLDDAKADRGKLTMQELLNTRNPELSGDRQKAQKVKSLQDQADAARLAGNVDKANELYSQVDAIKMGKGSKDSDLFSLNKEIEGFEKRGFGGSGYVKNLKDKRSGMMGIDSLKSNEKDPWKSMNDHLQYIREKIEKDGLPIIPKNGK